MTQSIQKAVSKWLENTVIGLNFCPFAKQEFVRQRIRFAQSEALTEIDLLNDLSKELDHLVLHKETETSLLVHPKVLLDFADYNQFLDAADALLEQRSMLGQFQIASFHPNYQFAGTEYEDAENFTNRSPYPLLHILRENSLAEAIRRHPNTEQIPQTNIETCERLGAAHLRALLRGCLNG